MDHRRLCRRPREFPAAVRLDRRPCRPAPHLPDRPHDLRRRVAPVQPRTVGRMARRLSHGAGARRLDAQSGCDVDHHQCLHRAARTRPCHRHLGWRFGYRHRARPAGRRHAGRIRRVAGHLLDQPSDRSDRPDGRGAVRSRLPVAAPAPVRPARPAGDGGAAGQLRLRDHPKRPAQDGFRRRRFRCSPLLPAR